MVQCVKNLPASARDIEFNPCSRKIPQAHIPQLLSPHSRAHELQPEKPPEGEKLQLEWPPLALTRERLGAATENLEQPSVK